MLRANRYGKKGVRLVLVRRWPAAHELRDLTVDLWLAGDFGTAYTEGDNSRVLPTDTMRATVYALAREHLTGDIEPFGATLARRLVAACPAAAQAEVSLREHPWERVGVDGRAHAYAFWRGGEGEQWTARVQARRDGGGFTMSGLAGLLVLKTTGSAFTGFLQDEYTVLPEARDRLLATEVHAEWEYARMSQDIPFGTCREVVRRALLEAFATHDESRSLQHTLYAMGEAALHARPELRRITLTLPNRHHVVADPDASGQPAGSPAEVDVYVATDRPYGVIEGTVER